MARCIPSHDNLIVIAERTARLDVVRIILGTFAHAFLLSEQIKAKYNSLLVDLFRETFCWLPLAHLLSNKVLPEKLGAWRSGCVRPLLSEGMGVGWVEGEGYRLLGSGAPCWAAHSIDCRVQVLVVHGGLFSRDGVTLDDIRAINRNMCARCTWTSARV